MLVTRALVGAITVVLAAGCGSSSTVDERGPVAFMSGDPEGGDAALLEAVVDFDGVCLLVQASDGTRYLPVFYRNAVDFDGSSLSWDGGTFDDGDSIRLPGGGSTGPARAADYVPGGCVYDVTWYVAT